MYGANIYAGIEYGGVLPGGTLDIMVSETVNDVDVVFMFAGINALVINCLNPLQGFWSRGLVIVGP